MRRSLRTLYDLLLYPLKCRIRGVLHGLIEQVRQHRYQSQASERRAPSLDARIGSVHEDPFGLLHGRMDRESRKRPKEGHVKKSTKKGDMRICIVGVYTHGCDGLEYGTFHGDHAHTRAF